MVMGYQTSGLPGQILWRAGLCALFSLVFFSGCATDNGLTDEHSQAQVQFQKGLEEGALNNRQGMIAHFQEAVDMDPENDRYRLHLGTAFFLAGDLERSEQELKRTLEINKNSKDAYRQLGRLYMQKEDWPRAVKNFKEDLKRPGTPLPHRVYNWLALSHYNQGDFDEAEKVWIKAIDLKDNAAIRLNLALAYKDREKFDEALVSLKKAVSLNKKFPQAHYELSQLLIRNKQMEEAAKHFKEVIRLAPGSEWSRLSKEYLELIRGSK